jgi:hypothetical protein
MDETQQQYEKKIKKTDRRAVAALVIGLSGAEKQRPVVQVYFLKEIYSVFKGFNEL